MMKQAAKGGAKIAFSTAFNEDRAELDEPILWLTFRHRGEKWKASCSSHSRVLFLLHGALQIMTNNNKNILLTNEQFMFLPKGYNIKVTARSDSRYILLNFSRKRLSCGRARLPEVIEREIVQCTFPILDTPPLMSAALTAMQNVNNIINEKEYQDAKEHELWALFWQCFPRHKVAWFLQAAIRPDEDFRIFVQCNFTPLKTVGHMAAESNMCEDRFRKLFLMYFKMLPSDWITQKRISKMKTMVRDGETNSKQIMTKLGFKSMTSFNKFCNSKLGCTPSDAIKKLR